MLGICIAITLSRSAAQQRWAQQCEPAACVLDHPAGTAATRPLCPWESPGKSAGAGRHCLLQRIFPTQGLNVRLLGLLHWQVVLYH